MIQASAARSPRPVPDPGAATVAAFDHLRRLLDDTGLLEHAEYTVPRREHGYCLDDNARALLVVVRQAALAPDVVDGLAPRFLAFIRHAQTSDGRFHNRLGYDRRFADPPGTGDWWGRALWALGATARRDRTGELRAAATEMFERSAHHRPPHLRPLAFAALGAAELLAVHPRSDPARELLVTASARLTARTGGDDWAWPEPRLAYANGVLPAAMLAAGDALRDRRVTERGLDLLGWLVGVETRHGHLSVTPAAGWGPGEPRPGFDQQPVELAAIAEAAARAHAITHDVRWARVIHRAARWFEGANDLGVPMVDRDTGGAFDGLTPIGPNRNQGAESTLAWIATAQHAATLGA